MLVDMPSSRYASVSRRAFLRAAAAAALGAVLPPQAVAAATKSRATTKKKASTARSTTTATTKAAQAGTATTTTALQAATTRSADPVTTSVAVAAAPPVASGEVFPASQELAVRFTFTNNGGGLNRNPFIATWIEGPSGGLVRTMSLWFQPGKGRRWLPDLRAWYRLDQVRALVYGTDLADTISSPTRLPGTYTVVWDGKDTDGVPVALGEYYVCIEAARERGPYELIREKVSVGTTPFTKKLSPQGELSEASVELRSRG